MFVHMCGAGGGVVLIVTTLVTTITIRYDLNILLIDLWFGVCTRMCAWG